MSRDPSDPNSKLPPWLREQPLPSQPAEEPASTPPSGAAAGDELPDWLREPTNDAPMPSSQEDVPDWLRATAEPATPAKESDALPDWLREAHAEEQPSTPARDEADASVPDWLRGLAEETNVDEPQPQTPQTTSETEGVPDWLRAMVDEPVTSAPSDKPDWLYEPPPADAPQQTVPIETDRPADTTLTPSDDTLNWLQSTDSMPSNEQPSAAHSNTRDDEIENWLRDVADPFQEPLSDDDPSALKPFDAGGSTPFDQPLEPRSSGWLDDTATTPSWLDAPQHNTANNDDFGGDVPAWLSSTGPESSQASAFAERDERSDTAEANDDAFPSWLGGGDTQKDATDSLGSTEPFGSMQSQDIPNWLQQTDSPVSPEAPRDVPEWLPQNEQSAPSQTQPHDIPEWLRQDETHEPAGSIPAWLRDTATSGEQTNAPEAPNTPDWLNVAEPTDELPTPPISNDAASWLREPPPPTPDDDSLPSWFRDEQAAITPTSGAPIDTDIPPWLRDDSGARLPTADAPGDQALPPWLKGADVMGSVPTQQPAQPSTPASSTNWFNEALSGSGEETNDSGLGFLGTADLPAFLRSNEPKQTDTAGGEVSDLLARIRNTDEDELAAPVRPSARFTPPANPVRSAEQTRAIALLEQLANTPELAVALEPSAARPSFWRRIGFERFVYVLLLAALLLGPLLPSLSAPLQMPPPTAGAQALFDQVSALGENDVVLIGYDWDARRVAELRPLEQAVVNHLIEQRVKLVLMSTDPQGSLLLYDLRDQLIRAGYQPAGQDYILLGYQPGGEFALRSIAQNLGQTFRSDFQGEDVSASALATGSSRGGQPIQSLQDFSMIMLLADDQVDVQSWVEQVQRVVPTVPFATLLTAEAAPAAEPYLQQPNVYGLSGTIGALAYTTLRGGDAAGTAVQSGQLRLGMASFATLLLVGSLIGLLVGAVRRRKA